jgi:hypothetical protein
MRIRKLIGGKRRLNQIDQWANCYSNFDIEIAVQSTDAVK